MGTDGYDKLYWTIHDSLKRTSTAVAPVDLVAVYNDFKDRYFKGLVPELSDKFVCVFHKLPPDVSGITIVDDTDAARYGVTPKGIRINEHFKDYSNETRVALLHEMIHASGIKDHNEKFIVAMVELFCEKRAYLEPLIL